jgi:hypothetical protein
MRRLVAVVLSSVLVLAGCTGPDATVPPSATSPTASGRLTVPDAQVTFPRPFQAARLVEAEVLTNYPADTLVTSARLESPLFADSPPRDTPVRLNPDWTNPVRLPLGTAVCPAPEGESTIILEMTVDGRAVTETLTADDTVLRQINADECAEQAILDVATPSFGPITVQDASHIEMTIVLTRGDSRTDEPVTLAEMTGNIIFIVRPDASESTLAPGADSVAIPAIVEIGRCDPHVFAESKKTWVFPAYLAIGDADPAYVEIQPDETTRAALKKLFDDCGEAERNG